MSQITTLLGLLESSELVDLLAYALQSIVNFGTGKLL